MPRSKEYGHRYAQILIPWLRASIFPREAGQKVPGEFLIGQAGLRWPPPWPIREIIVGHQQVKNVSETRHLPTTEVLSILILFLDLCPLVAIYFLSTKKNEKLSTIYHLQFLLSFSEFCIIVMVLFWVLPLIACVTFNTILSLYFLIYSFWTMSIDLWCEK